MEVGAGSEILGAEAGAWVVDFEEFDWVAGAVADRSGDVGGVAAGSCDESGEQSEGGDRTHESQEYQAGRGRCARMSQGADEFFAASDTSDRRRHSASAEIRIDRAFS